MKYIELHWSHPPSDEPEYIYSEYDDKAFETRRVEIAQDGSISHTDGTTTVGNIELSESLFDDAYAGMKEGEDNDGVMFKTIAKDVFDAVWAKSVTPRADLQ